MLKAEQPYVDCLQCLLNVCARIPQEFNYINASMLHVICLPESMHLDLTTVFIKIVFLVCISVLS